jgi:hypothetical protein
MDQELGIREIAVGFSASAKKIVSFHRIQTGFRTNPHTYTNSSLLFLRRGGEAIRLTTHLVLTPKLKMREAITPVPQDSW